MNGAEKPPVQKTRLIIGEPSAVKVDETDSTYPGRELHVARNQADSPVSYYRLSNLSRTQSIEIVVREGSAKRTVQLPEEMLERIATYMRTYEKPGSIQDVDCAAFVHFVNGVPFSGPPKRDDWMMSRLNENTLPVGGTILIATPHADDPKMVDLHHWAIYLGNGLYISKLGGSRLFASNLDEMKKMYGSDTIALEVIPKNAP